MAGILRGDVIWADLNPVRGREQAGLSPVLVISHDVFNQRSGTVIALAITSHDRQKWTNEGGQFYNCQFFANNESAHSFYQKIRTLLSYYVWGLVLRLVHR